MSLILEREKQVNKCACKKYKKFLCTLVCIVICICSTACGNKQPVATEAVNEFGALSPEYTVNPTEGTQSQQTGFVISTAVCPLYITEENAQYLRHMEVVQNGEILEVFYAKHGELELEAFRILFRNCEAEDDIGIVELETGKMYISVAVSSYDAEAFQNEEIEESYYAVLSELNNVLDSIHRDSRFLEKNELELEESIQDFTYWKVGLPEQISWVEDTEGGYTVTFYANISDKQIKLYAVSIGGKELQTQQGFYRIDGTWLPVSVESYELEDSGLTENQARELYTMMSTINDVLQAIISSENYSEQLPE